MLYRGEGGTGYYNIYIVATVLYYNRGLRGALGFSFIISGWSVNVKERGAAGVNSV